MKHNIVVINPFRKQDSVAIIDIIERCDDTMPLKYYEVLCRSKRTWAELFRSKRWYANCHIGDIFIAFNLSDSWIFYSPKVVWIIFVGRKDWVARHSFKIDPIFACRVPQSR